MTKEQLLELIEKLPNGAHIVLNETSFDGTPNYRNIKEIEYEDYNNVYVIK